MLRDTISEILGERIEADLSRKIKKTITEFPEVSGAYDLILHSYGPEKTVGSVHIAIPDTMTADQIDALERRISQKIYLEHQVAIAGISIYSENTKNDRAAAVCSEIRTILNEYPEVLQMHGFYLEETSAVITFDVILDFDAKNRREIYQDICRKVQERFPEYQIHVALDYDISD